MTAGFLPNGLYRLDPGGRPVRGQERPALHDELERTVPQPVFQGAANAGLPLRRYSVWK